MDEDQNLHQGDIIDSGWELFLVARVSCGGFKLISLQSGNRYSDKYVTTLNEARKELSIDYATLVRAKEYNRKNYVFLVNITSVV